MHWWAVIAHIIFEKGDRRQTFIVAGQIKIAPSGDFGGYVNQPSNFSHKPGFRQILPAATTWF